MTNEPSHELLHRLRLRLFREAAETGRIPQAPQLADDLGLPECDVRTGLRALGRAKVLILSPNDDSIWTANPFCAVPSGIRVDTVTRSYWAICVWDALGISAALGVDAVITAPCGYSGDPLHYQVVNGELVRSEGVVHFAVPAQRWWDNIGFT